ncbi:P-selectin [Amia ocellicauda]|uniref:P-selectin n=1 Tax=Amia ocellicauda TaxID=2972642 RepID=UPI0034642A28
MKQFLSCHLRWNFLKVVAVATISYDLMSGGTGVMAWTYHHNIKHNMNWNAARQWCREHFTDMVAIQNQNEIVYLNTTLPANKGYYWIGIRKINGEWTWVGTNKTLTKEAENWATGEPNNKGDGQDCVEIYIKRPKDSAKWNDEPCTKQKGVLCYQASCNKTTCGRWGECVETIGSYHCVCFEGFKGPHCDEAVECETLQAPDQGAMSCEHPFEPFRFNSTCTFQCDPGFVITGSQHVRCQAAGQWTLLTPLCQAVTCSALNVPGRVFQNCTHPIEVNSFNSTCEFSCEAGFLLKGSDRVRCDSSGTWTNHTPTCEVITCGSLAPPSKGRVSCNHPVKDFSYNSSCEFVCDEGYSLLGESTVHCTVTGTWTAETPPCKAVKCEELQSPSHGTIECEHPIEPFSYTSECRLTCEEGFLLNGTNITLCTSQGLWTHPTPHCQARPCAPLKAPDRGKMTCFNPQGEFRFGSRCDLGCEEGFVLRGSDTLQCAASGLWTHALPSCQAVKCEELQSPSHGTIECEHPIEPFSYTSECRLTCEEGFLLNGTNITLCTSQGLWTHPTPHCQARPCAPLKAPDRGKMTCFNPQGEFRFGSRCDLGCEEGFVLRGSDTLQCAASGLWTHALPSCQAVKCEELQSPSHGTIGCEHPIEPFSYTSECRLTCEEGFLLNGTNITLCTSQGLWTHPNPHCQARPCAPLKAPDRGKMTCFNPQGEFRFGSRCDLGCEEGFVLRGSDTLQCAASGLWTHALPSCQAVKCEELQSPSHGTIGCEHPIEPFSYTSECRLTCEEGFLLNGTNITLCTSQGLWTHPNPHCQARPCAPLKAPDRGKMTCFNPQGEFRFGSRCDLGCEEGFVLRGSDTLQCAASGLWTHALPSCQAVKCEELQSPSHGTIGCEHPIEPFSYTSECRLTCEEGFLLNGTNITLCTSQGLWTHPTPHCQARPCAPLKAPDRGKMTCFNPQGEFRFGSRCDLGCEEGFVLRGSDTLQCAASGLWTHALPSCQAVKCEELQSPSHGTIECEHPIEPFSYTSECRLTCEEGFLLNGTNITLCTSQGLWTHPTPHCQVMHCDPLEASPPLSMNCSHPLGNFSFSSQCDFTCVKGYKINATRRLACSSAGIWSETKPSCKAQEMPVGMSMLLYAGVSSAAAVSALLLSGLTFLIAKRLLRRNDKKNKLVPEGNSILEERENPMFEAY